MLSRIKGIFKKGADYSQESDYRQQFYDTTDEIVRSLNKSNDSSEVLITTAVAFLRTNIFERNNGDYFHCCAEAREMLQSLNASNPAPRHDNIGG